MTEHHTLQRKYSPTRTRRLYRSVTWFYDSWGKLTEDKASGRLLELAAVTDGSEILEVAVGTGRLFAKLAALNPSGHLEGIELSPAMLSKAIQRMRGSDSQVSYRLQEADAYQLPFADGRFDYLFNAYMLDLLPQEDFPALLAQFRRVLKPGGKLAIASFSRGTNRLNRLWYWLARWVPALLTDCRPIDAGPALTAAGFDILHAEEISQNTFPSAVFVAIKSD
jgi:demethylmenaquinone methyltransferase/2-methoxy-6-polyprenyl-1,4-benzoquinol methylase